MFGIAVAAISLLATNSSAEPTVAELSGVLRTATDFRMRVQAALVLGASKDTVAVAALCDGLSDTNSTVRASAAAALGRLRMQTGLECLERQELREQNQSVKTQIEQAVLDIDQANTPSRAPDGSTYWYVVVAPSINKSTRSVKDVDRVVQAAVRQVLLANPRVALAPIRETVEEGRAIVSQHGIRGYMLQPTVEAFEYGGGSLSVSLRLTMLSYPDQTLQGDFSSRLTQSGTPREDRASENELIKSAAVRTTDSFLDVVQTSRR